MLRNFTLTSMKISLIFDENMPWFEDFITNLFRQRLYCLDITSWTSLMISIFFKENALSYANFIMTPSRDFYPYKTLYFNYLKACDIFWRNYPLQQRFITIYYVCHIWPLDIMIQWIWIFWDLFNEITSCL